MIYPKIHGVYKRYLEGKNKGKFIIGQYSKPEFELLKDIKWIWEEKLDGTNIRLYYYTCPLILDNMKIEIKGRTDKAEIPTHLIEKISSLLPIEKFKTLFPDSEEEPDIYLYGEGLGYKIQNGSKYMKNPKDTDFILFDIKIGRFWLKREDIEKLANQLGLKVTPVVGEGTIDEAISFVKKGFKSTFGDFIAEGLVIKPKCELRNRFGERIITKIKGKDFTELAITKN